MSQTKWFRRAAASLLVCASVVTLSPAPGSVGSVVSAQAVADAGGEFHALAPTRILDTRPEFSDNDASLLGPKRLVASPTTDSSGEFHFNPLAQADVAGLPDDASDVLAIVANVTVVGATQPGYISIYPRGFDYGGPSGNELVSSLVNFAPGDAVPNLAIVGLDDDGFLTVNGGTTPGTYHLIIDLLGFVSTSSYAGSSVGARLEVVAPGRVLDTRQSTAIGPGETLVLPLHGADTIQYESTDAVVADIVPDRPAVTAALVNLTLINNFPGARSTFLTATPEQIPTTGLIPSSSNVTPGNIKATTTVVPISSDGSIRLYNGHGNLHVAVDVLGYFEQGIHQAGNRGRIVPLEAPFRALDTRLDEHGDAPLQHGSKEEWSFDSFVNSVVLNPGAESETPAPPQQGLIGSLVAIDLQPLFPQHAGGAFSSYLQVAPAGESAGVTSNVNFFLNTVVANMSLVKYGEKGSEDHIIEVFNVYGQVDYLLDVYAIVLDD